MFDLEDSIFPIHYPDGSLDQASVSFVLCSFSYPPGGKGIH